MKEGFSIEIFEFYVQDLIIMFPIQRQDENRDGEVSVTTLLVTSGEVLQKTGFVLLLRQEVTPL